MTEQLREAPEIIPPETVSYVHAYKEENMPLCIVLLILISWSVGVWIK